MIIDKKLNQFLISFNYDPELVLAVKELPERRYDKDRRLWIVPATHKREIIRFGSKHDFTFTTAARNWVEAIDDTSGLTQEEISLEKATVKTLESITPQLPNLATIDADTSLPEATGKRLFRHQVDGVKMAIWKQKLIIADDLGLGKTLTSLVAARNLGHPVIVVCPASLIDNWKREAQMAGVALDGIWSYGKMPVKWPKPYTLIADEAHAFQNPHSQRGKKFLALSKDADALMALTGTPIKNGKPINLMPLLMACEHETVSNLSHYQIHFCNARKTPWSRWDCSGARNLTELHARTKDVILRRTKKECLDLPEKIRQMVPVKVANEARYYEEIQELIRQFRVEVPDPMTMTRSQAMGFMMRARRFASIEKVAGSCEVVDQILEQGGKVVVFTAFVDSAKLFAQKYKEQSLMLIGETNVSIRQSLVDKFQTDPKKRVFVCTYGAGGVGITLTASTNVVLVDRTFVPGDAEQAEGRCILRDTPIYTVSGGAPKLKPIQDVIVGDKVISHSGKLCNVSGVSKRLNKGLVVEIDYIGGCDSIKCTHHHKIYVKRNSTMQWIEAKNVLPTDMMAFPKQKDFDKINYVDIQSEWRIYDFVKPPHCVHPKCDKPILCRNLCTEHYRSIQKIGGFKGVPIDKQINSRYKPLPGRIEIDDNWLYLMGWYVAEGFSRIKKNGIGKFVSFSGHRKEKPILDSIAKTLKKIGINSVLSIRGNSAELRSYSGELAMWFRDWFGHLARNKSLPQEIMNLPPEQAKIFMRGYIDGDGYERGNQIEWVSASPILSYQMCLLAIRCGFIPTLRRVAAFRPNTVDHYVGAYTVNGKASNPSLLDQNEDFIFRPIRSVKIYRNKDWYYDLTVENDHSFTIGFSTVHNCHRIGTTGTVMCSWIQLDELDTKIDGIIESKEENIELVLAGKRKTVTRNSAESIAMAMMPLIFGEPK